MHLHGTRLNHAPTLEKQCFSPQVKGPFHGSSAHAHWPTHQVVCACKEGLGKRRAGNETVGNVEKGRPQVHIEGGSRAQGRLDLTLTPRSVGSSEVACWDQKCCMSVTGYGQASFLRPRKESVSFLRFWMYLGDCGLNHLHASVQLALLPPSYCVIPLGHLDSPR